jgi:hypothetical protein
MPVKEEPIVKGMKIWNIIKTWDVYVLAETPEEALKAVGLHIRQEGLRASEEVAIETREERNVRAAWRDEKPMVADDVSDADFERAKGKTTIEVFNMLHVRDPKKAAAK